MMIIKDERTGSYTVEFTLLLPIIILISAFMFEMGWWMQLRYEAVNIVTETCGEDFLADIEARSDCVDCYGSVTLVDDYWVCLFVDEHEQITGLLPDALVPIEIKVEALKKQTENVEQMIKDYIEGETGYE